MAKFERFRYIPMLVRAYQEARTRADSRGTQTMPHSSFGDMTMKASDAGNITNAQSVYRESGARNPVNRPISQRRKKTKVKQSPLPERTVTPNRAPKKATKQLTRGQKTPVRVPQAAFRSHPVVQNLLKELRATKQQLGQLTAIQTQLAEVQTKLDEQLRVLRETVDADKKQTALSAEEASHGN